MRKTKFQHPALEYCEEHNGTDFIIVQGSIIVCPTCEGTGVHDRQDLDCSKLVDNMYDDGDFDGVQNYFNGQYSQVCKQCNGKNVVVEPNWNQLPEWAMKAIEEWDQSERDSRAEEASERAMGA